MNRFGRSISLRLSFFLLVLITCTAVGREATAARLIAAWGDASSNEDGFKIERKTGTNGTYVQIAVTSMNTTTYLDSTLSNSTEYCYRVRAYNATGESAYSDQACGTTAAPDTQFPTVSLTAPGNGTAASGPAVTVSANASDNIGIVGVQFLLDGANLGSEDTTAPYSISWNSTSVANGAYTLTARARDAAGNQATSTGVTMTVSNTAPQPGTGGLVAAYTFDENNGTSTMDASGQGNTGAISNATWTTSGKFGNALSFNGTNAWVTIPDAASLDLTTGMTLEAWVFPTTTTGVRDIVLKEGSTVDIYNLYARNWRGRPEANVFVGGTNRVAEGTTVAANVWTHVAGTYDGSVVRLFVNGVPVASTTTTGTIATSTGPLRIGGNSLWGEYFQGVIDNVRIYNRALTGTELQANMNTPVGTTPPPSVTYILTITKAGTGGGVVNASGINCGTDCSESYTANTTVALTATPASGSIFAGWSGDGDCSDSSVTMTIAKTCTATFTLVPSATYTLMVTKAGTGSGTVSGTGLSCGTDCSESYTANTTVALTASPAAGSTFAGWSGDGDCSDSSVTMTIAKTCTATFTLVPPATYALTVTKAGTGSGTVSGTGLSCGTDCSESYTANTTVALTASPAAGSTFAGWSGDGDCSDSSVTMTIAKTCTATFTRPLQVQIGIFRPSTATWYLDLNSNGQFDGCAIDPCPFAFGISTDRPIVGDWAGKGTFQLGTFDPTTKLWELDRNGNDKWEDCPIDMCRGPFGQSNDLPVAGYWKAGMTTAGIGTFRPSTGKWFLDLNGNGRLDNGTIDARLGPFGTSTDKPVVGNWAGNGVTRIGVFTPSTGNWQLDLNGNGVFDGCTTDSCRGPFGISGDLPVAGDWTGTGRTQIGVFTPANGQWKLDVNGNGVFDGCTVDACLGSFGQTGDLPVVGKW